MSGRWQGAWKVGVGCDLSHGFLSLSQGAHDCALGVHSSSLLSPTFLTEVLLSRVILAFWGWCLIPLP